MFGPIGAELLEAKWESFGAGSELTALGRNETRRARKDFTFVRLKMRFTNSGRSPEHVPGLHLADVKGYILVAPVASVTKERARKIAPRSSLVLELVSVMVDYERLVSLERFALVCTRLGWSYPIDDLPARSTLFKDRPKTKAKTVEPLVATLVSHEWVGMRKGTMIKSRGGRRGMLSGDVVGVDIKLRVGNPRKKEAVLRGPLDLVGSGGKPHRPLAPKSRSKITIPPGGTVEVVFGSKMGGIEKFRGVGQLAVVHKEHRWRFSIPGPPALDKINFDAK